EPTARILPCLTATASTRGRLSSIVRMGPPDQIMSATSAPKTCCGSSKPPDRTAHRTMVASFIETFLEINRDDARTSHSYLPPTRKCECSTNLPAAASLNCLNYLVRGHPPGKQRLCRTRPE